MIQNVANVFPLIMFIVIGTVLTSCLVVLFIAGTLRIMERWHNDTIMRYNKDLREYFNEKQEKEVQWHENKNI